MHKIVNYFKSRESWQMFYFQTNLNPDSSLYRVSSRLTIKALTLMLVLSSVIVLAMLYTQNKLQAQDLNVEGILIYSRTLPSGEIQLIQLKAGDQNQFLVPEGYCYGVSTHGEYIAVSSEERPSTLSIYAFGGKLVVEVSWNEAWISPCGFQWLVDENNLEIFSGCKAENESEDSSIIYFNLNISDGQITGPYSRKTNTCTGWTPLATDKYPLNLSSSQWASLPQHIEDDTAVLGSPHPDVVIYGLCQGKTGWNGWYEVNECLGLRQTAIYDFADKQIVEVLKDAPDLSFDHRHGGVVGIAQFGWSTTGRYLAYVSRDFQTIYIYDFASRQYLSSFQVPNNYSFDMFARPVWSANEQKIALWVSSHSIEHSTHDNRTIAILDVDSGDFKINVLTGEFSSDYFYWSPNNQALIFIRNGSLIYWDGNRQENIILDNNVDNILLWCAK